MGKIEQEACEKGASTSSRVERNERDEEVPLLLLDRCVTLTSFCCIVLSYLLMLVIANYNRCTIKGGIGKFEQEAGK